MRYHSDVETRQHSLARKRREDQARAAINVASGVIGSGLSIPSRLPR